MHKFIKVLSICNVLKDILIKVNEDELKSLGLTKGMMYLVSEKEQIELLEKFHNHEKKVEMGGSGTNMMRTMALLGQKVSQAGMVGNDIYGEMCINRINELGIVNNIKKSEVGSTGTSLILLTPDGERTMNTCLGVSRFYTVKDIPDNDIANSEYLLVTGYQWDTDNQIEAVNHAIRVARHNNTKVVLDISDPFCVERHKETFWNIIEEFVDVLFCNRKESYFLTGKNIQESLDILSEICNIVVIKNGSEGSYIRNRNKQIKIESNKVNVVDTTAAGDMYAGGFMYGLTKNLSLEVCGKIASFCAELVIQNVGATLPNNLKELVENKFSLKTLC
ncbi:MAG: adenosine kinase [Candidatus Sericytochromatia bacterium]|nr:MAG: adenosine kinase [Candidatus Sericytochromatia bacterium]